MNQTEYHKKFCGKGCACATLFPKDQSQDKCIIENGKVMVCYNVQDHNHQSKGELVESICKSCGKNFSYKKVYSRTIYCSSKCSDVARYYRDREKRLKMNRDYFKSLSPEKLKEKSDRARLKNPIKFKARYTLRSAVRQGKIKRLPCEVCNKTPTHGHHNDYSKPLEVQWLCKKHHYEKHRKHKFPLSSASPKSKN